MKLSSKALLLLAPLALAAHAEVTFTPMASYHFFDNEKLEASYPGAASIGGIEVENNEGFALGLGYRFTPAFGLEAHYGKTRSEIENTGGIPTRDSRLGLDGYYAFNAEGRFSPYILLGAGQQSFKVTGTPGAAPVDKGTYGNAALGAFIRFNDYVALRTEARDVYNFSSENNDILALVGLEFSGANGAAVVAEEPAPAPEPAPVVEEEPAPAPVVPAAPADSDGDGVSDDQDKCSNTPAGVAVDANGCPVDSDKDGVADYQDQCPDTAANVVVDEKGCAKTLTEKISKDINILFDSSKAVVKDEYKADIEEVAKLAQQYPTAFIEIQGHTDTSGNAKLNTKLSQARADAVKDVLVKDFGIDAGRLTATGYGSSQPVADNATAEGRAKNRRVVAVLSAEAKRVEVKKGKK